MGHSVETLRAALVTVHGVDTPFEVRDGADEGVDLVAGLRFSDPGWFSLFREVGLDTVYTIRIRLDEPSREVRTRGKTAPIIWKKGKPSSPRIWERGEDDRTGFGEPSGRVTNVSYRKVSWRKYEKAAEFTYRYEDLRLPLERAVARLGWQWRHKLFGKL